jgi:hypothetical protein
MLGLLLLDASVITTLVAACQWASKLGAFGAQSTAWATQNWRARMAHHSGLRRPLGALDLLLETYMRRPYR